MSKSEKLVICVSMVGVLVAIAAWLFPVNQSADSFSLRVLETYRTSTAYKPLNQVEIPVNSSTELDPPSVIEADSYLVAEMSFSSLMLHLKQLPLDSNKLTYIKSIRELLKAKISPDELNTLLDGFGLDSNKLHATSLLRNKLEPFDEASIEGYLSNFLLASSKQKAIELLQ